MRIMSTLGGRRVDAVLHSERVSARRCSSLFPAFPLPSVVPVIILVADGARPDTLQSAIDGGGLPNLARLRAEGGMHTVTTAWPSVTGVAYTPFLLGRYPGPVGLPGLRWFDRSRDIGPMVGHSRSYVGSGMRRVDNDLADDAPTMFELAGSSLGALNVIARGLPGSQRLGRTPLFVLRAAMTHFRGNVRGWLEIDRDIGGQVAARIRSDKPDFVFAAFVGIDKASHSEGHEASVVVDAMRIVDETVGEIRHDAERAGEWESTHVWIVSDHGHSPVDSHDDLAVHFRHDLGFRTLSHPWTFGNSHEVAIMVSGNAMAHVYLELGHRQRPFWPSLAGRWGETLSALLARESVDLAVVPHSATRVAVHGRGRGSAMIERTNGHYSYHTESGDPLGIGDLDRVCQGEAFEATAQSDYPDAVVQIAHLAGAARSGEVMLSASRRWDFREKYEPITHLSSHGALHREHMLVPLLLSHPAMGTPRRTVDVMPSALAALGLAVPTGLDGESFV